MEILDAIPLDLDAESMGERLHVKRTGSWGTFRAALEIAIASVNAKAGFAIAYVDERIDHQIVIGGVSFESRVLSKNLEHVGRVFPYVVTIGPALEERSDTAKDLLTKYYLDAIGNMALLQARKYLENQLRSKYALDRLSFMSPGSLEDWPIEQQESLFALLNGVERSVGVKLTGHFLMIPRKSVSGVFFPTESRFYSCQLCPRERCVGRKAAYSRELAEAYGIS